MVCSGQMSKIGQVTLFPEVLISPGLTYLSNCNRCTGSIVLMEIPNFSRSKVEEKHHKCH